MANILSNLLQVGLKTASPEIVFSSNVTPDIIINLSEAVGSKGTPATAKKAIKGAEGESVVLKLLRPEVTIETLGTQESFAPYGKPYAGMHIIILSSLAITGVLAGAIAWYICKYKVN